MSSVVHGGSGRSQRELASRLGPLGCRVTLLADRGQRALVRRFLLGQLADAAVRFDGRILGRLSESLRAKIGKRAPARTIERTSCQTSVAPENAIGALIADLEPDVVVASSIDGVAWRKIRRICAEREVCSVLYLREETALGHLRSGLVPDVLIANSMSLVASSQAEGHHCEFVPSVVELGNVDFSRTPSAVLLVNPIASHGVGVAVALAVGRPDINVVLQESWPLAASQRSRIERLASDQSNLEFRTFVSDPSELFRDALLLLAPHRIDNRPRVVLEAQALGIPVVATSFAGLDEAVGEGGLLIDPGADDDEWVAALGSILDNPVRLAELSQAALAHAGRPEAQPDAIGRRFLELVGRQDLVEATQ